MLPATEQTTAVADLGVARHSAHGRVGERLHEPRDGVLLKDGVAIDHHHDLCFCSEHASGERGGLAAVGATDHAYTGQPECLDEVPRAVRGPVVDHDHLHAGIVRLRQGAHRALDPDSLVVGRHDDRDRRLELQGRP